MPVFGVTVTCLMFVVFKVGSLGAILMTGGRVVEGR
jgi:hypothetical protein